MRLMLRFYLMISCLVIKEINLDLLYQSMATIGF